MADVEIVNNAGTFRDDLESKKQEILDKWGILADGYATDLTPVDTGRLRSSITYADDRESVYIGSNVEYAPYVELGTYKRRAKPFLRPAIEDHVNEYKQIMEDVLKS